MPKAHKTPARLDPDFETFLLSQGFHPRNSLSEWQVTPYAADQSDPLLRYWRKQERIEEGETFIPYDVRVTFRLSPNGHPIKMTISSVPMITARGKSYLVVCGRNRITAYFTEVVEAFKNIQKVYRSGPGREKQLKPIAEQILNHANRQH